MLLEHRTKSSSSAASLDRSPRDFYTPYVCRSIEARHVECFIVGLLRDLEVGASVQFHRQRSS
jgi:hypothetical protein